MEVFLRKDFRNFDPKHINANLRGRIFLFTDTILSKNHGDLSQEDIHKIIDYLLKYLDFAVNYLKNFTNYLAAVII